MKGTNAVFLALEVPGLKQWIFCGGLFRQTMKRNYQNVSQGKE
jgi:hypothetical protein